MKLKKQEIIKKAIQNKRILSTGYNRAPSSLSIATSWAARAKAWPPEPAMGCAGRFMLAKRHHLGGASRYKHRGGKTLYWTHQLCILCAKMMINARIARVVYKESYPNGTAFAFLKEAGIEVEKMKYGA